MSQELERVYTINLGKVKLSQSQHRAVRAINMIREFARHHMKVEEIKIEEELAHQIWAKGVRNPPRKIRVRMSKTDEGYVLVSPYTDEVESTVIPEKDTEKISDKIESKKFPTVTKNSSGYRIDKIKTRKDAHKVIIGSEGTLGVILSAKLEIKDNPKKRVLLIVEYKSITDASMNCIKINETKPSAIEFVDKITYYRMIIP